MTARRPSSGSLHGLNRVPGRRSTGNLAAMVESSEARGSSNQPFNVPTQVSTKGFKAIRSSHGSNGSLASVISKNTNGGGRRSAVPSSSKAMTRVQSGPSLLMNAGFHRQNSSGSSRRKNGKLKPSSTLLEGLKQQLLGSKQQLPSLMESQPPRPGSKISGTMTDKREKAAAASADPYAVQPQRCPLSDSDSSERHSPPLMEVTRLSSFRSISSSLCGSDQGSVSEHVAEEEEDDDIGLSGAVLKSLHPYHVILNQDFKIVQVGNSLPSVLKRGELDIVGHTISDVFEISRPVGMAWTWKWLRLIEEQSFVVLPTTTPDSHPELAKLCFKTTVVHVQEYPPMVMLLMTPDANNLVELRDMSLTLSDLPVHGAHRDAVFLREHLSRQMNNVRVVALETKSMLAVLFL